MGITVDPKYGGTGASFFSAVLVIEELAKIDPSVSVFCDVQNTLVNLNFKYYASPDLQDKYFPRIAQDTVHYFTSCEFPFDYKVFIILGGGILFVWA